MCWRVAREPAGLEPSGWEVGEVVIYLTGSQTSEGLVAIESPLVWEAFGEGRVCVLSTRQT